MQLAEEQCSVCQLEFNAATPNEAVFDGVIRGTDGKWGYACKGHKDYVVFTDTTAVFVDDGFKRWWTSYRKFRQEGGVV